MSVGVGLRSLSRAFAVEQRVVVVTGGAKGIGLGVSNAFAAGGDAVIALYDWIIFFLKAKRSLPSARCITNKCTL